LFRRELLRELRNFGDLVYQELMTPLQEHWYLELPILVLPILVVLTLLVLRVLLVLRMTLVVRTTLEMS
jgi:hypothetical protein